MKYLKDRCYSPPDVRFHVSMYG
ncbi:hypothetical protein CL3_03900 [butyrate-producing bacterium SM4/1]|nr:hypothetical protein CLS_00150 [[Clostridium] cf. saccharolyticum K10]CBL35624.1 hypothetical protein CL3_03900 [butyrate-producing bacterium SM4/1]